MRYAYIAGPMRGIPFFNFPLFNAVEWVLTSEDAETKFEEIFNPAAHDNKQAGKDISNEAGSEAQAKSEHGFSLRAALKADTDFICDRCTDIYMLPGWEKSEGAQAEWRLAIALKSEGVKIHYISEEMALASVELHQAYLSNQQEKSIV